MKASLFNFALLILTKSAVAQLTSFSDEFNVASNLNQWSRIEVVEGWNANQLAQLTIDEDKEKLIMIPHTCTWYGNYRGPLVFKTINSTSFAITTEVSVTNRAGDGYPNALYSLAGLMIRKPRN